MKLPQVRPIEKFWSLCKNNYSKIKKEPKNIQEFKKIWKKISFNIAKRSGKNLMNNVRNNIRFIGRHGVYKFYK